MVSFEMKDIEGLIQCPKCDMWSNRGYCWNCEYDYEKMEGVRDATRQEAN